MTSAKLMASSMPGMEPVRSDRKEVELSSRPSSSPSCGVGSTSCDKQQMADQEALYHVASPSQLPARLKPTHKTILEAKNLPCWSLRATQYSSARGAMHIERMLS